MTRKHFIAMAQEIALIEDLAARKQAAQAFSAVARAVNRRFDSTKFFTACGV